MAGERPYLSIVVTARNDDHGGNLLGRMQAFVNAWIAQSERHGLTSELIIVEWNPPGERPYLAEALNWPKKLGACDVRIIQVPPDLHRRYAHSEALPLYQMIAKNVGIRRACGRFVLATNIDIVFSNALVRFLADGKLEPRCMYRIDRHDVMAEVPIDGIDEQLAYCETHLIRVNAREGTFSLTPDGHRALSPNDVAAADSGIVFGPGWFPLEYASPWETFRWATTNAEFRVSLPSPGIRYLKLDIEPGPGVGTSPAEVVFVNASGNQIARATVFSRGALRIPVEAVPDEGLAVVRSHVLNGGQSIPLDPRILEFRVFRCEWELETAEETRTESSVLANDKTPKDSESAQDLETSNESTVQASDTPTNGLDLAPPREPSAESPIQASDTPTNGLDLAPPREPSTESPIQAGDTPTNGLDLARPPQPSTESSIQSGDPAPKGPEFALPPESSNLSSIQVGNPSSNCVEMAQPLELSDQYSIQVGAPRRPPNLWVRFQRLIATLAYGEDVVLVPIAISPKVRRVLRIYVDNGGITGLLRHGLKSETSVSQPFAATPIVAMSEPAANVARGDEAPLASAPTLAVSEPLQNVERFTEAAPIATLAAAVSEPVANVERSDEAPPFDADPTLAVNEPVQNVERFTEAAPIATLAAAASEPVANVERSDETPPFDADPMIGVSEPVAIPLNLRPTHLHTNGCGDFTLMSLEDWLDLRGYPEFDVFSMHLDSVFCISAHYGGVVEKVLEEPMRIYHIEHGTGSGWTPEGQSKLFARIAARGLTMIENPEVIAWATQMRKLQCPMIFNLTNWGLAEFNLSETKKTRPDV